jgi:two-component system, OmpR family, alkaline phosphatase synthesis response regulator PhoP
MRILVVEDEVQLAEAVARGLRREGMAVDVATDGDEGYRKAALTRYDVVVLDRDLPGMSGDEICRRLTDEGVLTRVMMLTASGTVEDKVTGLALGADDYLAKPFGLGELLARVEALLRRRPPRDDREADRIKFGDIEADLGAQTVARNGAPVEVTPQEFKVLRLFLQSGGRALSRDDILARCWGAEYEGTPHTVDNFFRSLRVKLERDPEQPRHFLTVRGHGYRFER